MCFNAYSTWKGRMLLMKDLYIKSGYRGMGVGKKLLILLAKYAKKTNDHRIDFHVLKWNPASNFYKAMGAVNITEINEFHFHRINL